MYFAGNGPGAMKKNGKLSTKEMIHPWYGTDHLGVDDISNMLVPAPACNTNACSSMPPLEPDSPVNMQECRGQGVAATRPQHNARCAVQQQIVNNAAPCTGMQQQCCTMHLQSYKAKSQAQARAPLRGGHLHDLATLQSNLMRAPAPRLLIWSL